ncbi:Serine threonine-kinase Nek7 [Hyphodiscus hymeniophilus]|uniref:Serine threonine-kinase Nek7 n=1 Tax=Hyphodiscus hymeniophilus TaxID=353542 RepID=A0A9P7AYW0_9HELO|nr:Serine threonine-kinase Nek7 [Hyphodiscus hymeniophilus]
MSQPRQHGALEEFFAWESQSWVEVVADMTTEEKAYFMPLDDLKTYWGAHDCNTLTRLLAELFQPHYPPIDAELILREHTAIFCILLRIGQGVLIEHFARYEELSDPRLPFDTDHPPRGFPVAADEPALLQKFCEKQWMYCVPKFDDHMLNKHFGRQRLLPIVYKEPRGTEGMADKYMIKLFGPHNEMLSVGRRTAANDPNVDSFMLKRYATQEGEAAYKKEVNGYRSVKHADTIIKYYGSYIHGHDFNILLECADKGSLEEYFQRESPPSRGVDIIKFWENIFQLIKGLKAIHSIREAHQDVRPDRIHVVSNGVKSPWDWQFKFANFGLNINDTVPEEEESTTNDTQDTAPYGSPECYLPYTHEGQGQVPPKITWAADIWALGCIFSEAAMWIADGYKGLLEYRRQRMAETDRILFKSSHGFHDGEHVLQAVRDCHRDIEDRLRRSDYITKDVLDTMVDEMLWEEDRPNAKALTRKADVILSKARNKLSGDQFPRPPGSRQGRSLPRHAPPTAPLPPIPRGLSPGLASIAERQYSPNVENWRSQVTDSRIGGSQRTASGIALRPSPSRQNIGSTLGSVSDIDRELDGSIASWQLADNNSSVASPITPFTSPHASVYYDNEHAPSEGRPRVVRSQSNHSGEYRRPSVPLFHARSTPSHNDTVTAAPVVISPAVRAEQHTYEEAASSALPVQDTEINRYSVLGDLRSVDESRVPARAASKASSRHSSSGYSTSTRQSLHQESIQIRTDELAVPAKSQKRLGGFSLFPSKTRGSPPSPRPETAQPSEKNFFSRERNHSSASVPRSIPPLPGNASVVSSSPADEFPNMDFLSVNTCLEWKKAHKKVKKHSMVPPLPGQSAIEPLSGRDHVFIVDDSKSMVTVWAEVKRVFEALSYVVKGMSPDGTELYFTISYDTWRRKDTFDLVDYLEKKTTGGETNISYRLDLQLQTYRARLFAAKGAKGKKAVVRPMSFYILTNGEWGAGVDPKPKIKEMADFLIASNMTRGQVMIEFISFAQSQSASQKISDLATTDFGVDIVGLESWRGNVLKMLRGPLDNILPGSAATSTFGMSRPGSRANTMKSGPIHGTSLVSELA